MILFTKEIEEKLQEQYPMGDDMEQMVICKIFNPYGPGTWYLLNQDPNDPDYIWAIVNIFETEMGSVQKSDLVTTTVKFNGVPVGQLERDLYFTPIKAKDLWKKLLNREDV